MEKENINIIKIENKNKWIDLFYQKVEKIGENEDYLKTNYIADREVKNKFSLEILKGKYYPENDSIILVLIYCKPPFFNNVTIYKGRFIDRKESIYLEGNVQCLYPNYLKELKEFKFNIIGVGFLIIMFFVGNFKEKILSLVIIMLFFIIVNLISRKKGYICNRKKIMKKLMEIELC